MRPPACTQCKWGTGTTCEKPNNSQAQKDMKEKLEQMKAEREKQDAAWFAPPSVDLSDTKKSSKVGTNGTNKTQ